MAKIQTQKAIDRLQNAFNDLPRLISNIAERDKISNSAAIDRFIDNVRNNINRIANSKQFDVDAAINSVILLESEIDFVKNIHAKNQADLENYKNLSSQRDKCTKEIKRLQKELNDSRKRISKNEQNARLCNESTVKTAMELANSNSQIEEMQTEIDNLTSLNTRLNNEIRILTTANERQKNIEESNRFDHDSVLKSFKIIFKEIYPNESIENLNNVLSIMSKFLKYIQQMGIITNDIETVTQDLSLDRIQKNADTIDNLQRQLQQITTVKDVMEKSANKAIHEKNRISKELNTLTEELDKVRKQRDEFRRRQDEAEKILESNVNENANNNEEIDDLRKQVQTHIQNLDILERDRQVLLEQYQKLESDQVDLVDQLTEDVNRQDELSEKMNKINTENKIIMQKLDLIGKLFGTFANAKNTPENIQYFRNLQELIDKNTEDKLQNFRESINRFIHRIQNSKNAEEDDYNMNAFDSTSIICHSDGRPSTPGGALDDDRQNEQSGHVNQTPEYIRSLQCENITNVSDNNNNNAPQEITINERTTFDNVLNDETYMSAFVPLQAPQTTPTAPSSTLTPPTSNDDSAPISPKKTRTASVRKRSSEPIVGRQLYTPTKKRGRVDNVCRKDTNDNSNTASTTSNNNNNDDDDDENDDDDDDEDDEEESDSTLNDTIIEIPDSSHSNQTDRSSISNNLVANIPDIEISQSARERVNEALRYSARDQLLNPE